MNQIRQLWIQHVYWTRFFIISTAADLADLAPVTNRLLQNPKDFAKLLAPIYGLKIAKQFQDLFTQHLLIAGDLVTAAKNAETDKANYARKRWYKNADEIAEFLSSINPYWDAAEWKAMLYSHLKMTEQEAECIRIRDIRRFVESGLGQRMKKAAMKKHLYREQPFVIQRNASMLDDGWKNETVLVQGIIDAYFMEEEAIVLVDYKTDRVKRGQEQKLIDLYHVQLEDYARALERMTGKRVKEKIIYSFTLQKEILL